MFYELRWHTTCCAMQTVNGVSYRTAIRDIAMATLFQLSGADPKDMGCPLMKRHNELLFMPKSLGFANEQQRQVAFQNWQSIRAQQRTVK